MARSVKYGRERLPSEQVESLSTSFAYNMSTRTPEPRLEPMSLDSSQPAQSKRKQRTMSLLRQIEPYNGFPEPESDGVSKTPRSTISSLSRPAPKPKPKRKTTNLLREIAPHNISPEPELKAASETPTRDSTQPPSRKRRPKSMPRPQLNDLQTSPDPGTDSEQENIRLKKPRSSQQASGNPPPTSAMLREIAAHNESPEDSEPDINLLRTSTEVPFLTRSARKDLEKILKNEALTPRKSLNVRSLMKAELLGTPKGTKTFYFEGHKKPRSSSHQTQLESPEGLDFNIGKDVDDDERFSKNTKPSSRSRSQPFSARRTDAVEAESPWSKWDSKKGQSPLVLRLV